MKKIFIAVLGGAALALFQSGCESTGSRERLEANTQQVTQLNAENKVLKKQLAATYERARTNEEQIQQLQVKINTLQEEQGENGQKIRVLEDQMIKMNRLEQKIAQEITTMKQSISAESKNLHDELNKVVDQVAQETATAINSLRKAQPAAESKEPKSGPVGKGEFYVHTVDKGHTLSAVAKAYKVTPEEIRKANNLKDDTIRVGQKLFIPKKK